MSFRLIFSDESVFYNAFDPGRFENDLPLSDSINSNTNGQTNTLPTSTGQTTDNTNSTVAQTSIDNLTNQIAEPKDVKIEILIADEKNDPTPQKVEIAVSQETADSLQAAIVEAQVKAEQTTETITPKPETIDQTAIQNPTTTNAPNIYVPQYSISDSSFTIIRGNEKTDNLTFSFDKLLNEGFDGSGIKDKNESSLLNRFIDFAKSVIKFVQPRMEYEYGADDMRKDKADKIAQDKIHQKIQEKLTNTHKPSPEELRKKENNKMMRKNEISQSDKKQKDKSQQNLQKVRINEEILKSLLKK
jgi:hypothetical protein